MLKYNQEIVVIIMEQHAQNSNLLNNFEVIVIGSGFAGLTAAIECKMNGGNVVVLEKMKAVGGNSIISDGGIAAPNTLEQHNLGIKDSNELMFEDMMKSAEGLNNPLITKIVCDNALDAYQWSKDILNVKYMPRVDIFGGHQVPRCYSPDPLSGSTIILCMKQKCEALGIEIRTGNYVESFILDHNQVIGVQVDAHYSLDPLHPKDIQFLYASKAVIVATGGFAADTKFIQKYNSDFDGLSQTTNKKTSTAEVLEACIDIQCATAYLDHIQWMPWSTNNETGYGRGGLFGDYIVSSYGILINTHTGERFVNELGNRKIVTQELLKVKDVIGIVDSTSVEKAGWDLGIALKKGIIKSHNTIDEIADLYTIPKLKLRSTITEYNRIILNKENDPWGKIIEPWMTPLTKAPFYSMTIAPKTHYSLGGLVTNSDTQVLNMDGQIIPGLFAVGEVTGLTHGANRLGSCSVTECLVMGRIAGRKSINK
jgi:flavocytochrome c